MAFPILEDVKKRVKERAAAYPKVAEAISKAETRAAEVRARIKEVIGGSPLEGGVLGGEKGILERIEALFPKIKEIREKRILARPSETRRETETLRREKEEKAPSGKYKLRK